MKMIEGGGGGGVKLWNIFVKCSKRSRKKTKNNKTLQSVNAGVDFPHCQASKHTQQVKFGKPQSAKNENNVQSRCVTLINLSSSALVWCTRSRGVMRFKVNEAVQFDTGI